MIKCPECSGEVAGIKVVYYCKKDHKWGEIVDRPAAGTAMKEPLPATSPFKVTVHGRELNLKPETKMMMPFGKYGPGKGDHRTVENLPIDYIEWCLGSLDNISPGLEEEMKNQIALKRGRGVAR